MKKTLIAIIIFIFSLPALAHTVFYLDRSIGEANCGHTTDSWDWYDPANRRCGTEGDPVYENPDGCQDYDDIGCYGYYIENDVWNGASGSFPVPSGGDTVYLRGDPNNAVQAHQISTITNSNSGTNGNPLSVRNYPGETVYISAAQLYTGTWTEVATNKWCTAVDSVGSDPEVVIFDKELGVPYRGSPNYDGDFAYDCTQSDRPWDGSGESCDCTGSGTGNNCDTCPDDYLTGDKQWCWDADGGAGVDDRLCVYSTSNPSTVYTSPGIEYGLYNYPVYLDSSAGNGIDYVEFRGDAQDHFFLEGGKYNGAYLYGNGGNSDFSSSGVGFYNLTSRFNYRGGFQVRGLKEVQAADWTIQDCKAVYNGQSGISYSDNNNNATIHRNEITDNGWSDFSDTAIQSSAESHYLAAGWTACGSGDCGAYSDIWISDDNQDYPVIEYIQLTIICSAVNDYLGAYYEDRRVDSYTSINSEGEWCDSVNTNNYCGTGNSAHSGKFFIYSTADLDTVCTSAGANAVYGRAVGVTISNNFVARQHDDFGPEGHGIQPSGDGIVVKNNFIYDVGHYGIHLGNTENAKIYYNIILDPSGVII